MEDKTNTRHLDDEEEKADTIPTTATVSTTTAAAAAVSVVTGVAQLPPLNPQDIAAEAVAVATGRQASKKRKKSSSSSSNNKDKDKDDDNSNNEDDDNDNENNDENNENQNDTRDDGNKKPPPSSQNKRGKTTSNKQPPGQQHPPKMMPRVVQACKGAPPAPTIISFQADPTLTNQNKKDGIPPWRKIQDMLLTEESVTVAMIQRGILVVPGVCPKCHQTLRFPKKGAIMRCSKCYSRNGGEWSQSLYKSTFFEFGRMKRQDVLMFLYHWLCGAKHKQLCLIMGWSNSTMFRWTTLVQELVATVTFYENYNPTPTKRTPQEQEAMEATIIKIGGQDVVVQIDDCPFDKRTCSHPDYIKGGWIFCGVEVTPKHRFFSCVCNDRSINKFMVLARKYIAPGSIIRSNRWTANDIIDIQPNSQYRLEKIVHTTTSNNQHPPHQQHPYPHHPHGHGLAPPPLHPGLPPRTTPLPPHPGAAGGGGLPPHHPLLQQQQRRQQQQQHLNPVMDPNNLPQLNTNPFEQHNPFACSVFQPPLGPQLGGIPPPQQQQQQMHNLNQDSHHLPVTGAATGTSAAHGGGGGGSTAPLHHHPADGEIWIVPEELPTAPLGGATIGGGGGGGGTGTSSSTTTTRKHNNVKELQGSLFEFIWRKQHDMNLWNGILWTLKQVKYSD